MDTREAFLRSTISLISGFKELAHYMVVGHTACIAILEVNSVNRDKYENVDLHAIRELQKVSPLAYAEFIQIFRESSMVLAFSWLESFLDEVEEALYLNDPAHLGDQVQIKLGKILTVGSLEELIHDVVKRRVRERSQWSLANRLKELREDRAFVIGATSDDLQWLSDKRNAIIHERNLGAFQVRRRSVSYTGPQARDAIDKSEVDKFITIVAATIGDLYTGACRALKITGRFPLHKRNRDLISSWKGLWTPEANRKR